MRNKRELFRHVVFRHLRDIMSMIRFDSDERNKSEYRAIAQNDITELWLYNYITSNTRDLLTILLYSI